ncbi:MAG: membrane protein insertion efficiency factor YidD [Candidatus Magasanikbacteria bacterium]|nr:membrane protein insertion efficiency factor YidD [Candidatus Magasanikbacteria bacterium]
MTIFEIPKRVSLIFIRVYQKTISPDHGFFRGVFPYGFCKYHPTCSEYGHQAIKKYGFFGGWVRAIWRILRCNPFSKGGIDNA